MTRYFASISHHSISRARIVPVGETLAAAKRAATREFGDEFLDYLIIITNAADEMVASRRAGERKWVSHQ
jgi:hypothetical protein